MLYQDERFKSLEEYAAYRLRQDKGMSMDEGIRKTMELIMEDVIPYDKARFGELPELLKNI
jgi:hypothetical protein